MWVDPKAQRVVGEVLAAARRRAGITQVELAARLDKAQSLVSAYENGQRRIDIPEFIEIIQTIGADPTREFQVIVTKLGERVRSRRRHR